jgi:hypothetical protein
MIDATFSLSPVWKSVESIIRLFCSIKAWGICVFANLGPSTWPLSVTPRPVVGGAGNEVIFPMSY